MNYTDEKSIQILISLLKKYDIKHLVLSPGSGNIPFVHSVEQDTFFQCYSIVDERSAAFFALGLIQKLQIPVAISCTSGTAATNYISAVTEAYYQNLPLVVITADNHPYEINQGKDQTIQQMGLFNNVCKKAVQLPVVKDKSDFLACQRMINEALLELDHHGRGPVHINTPIMNKYSFNTSSLPKVKKINRYQQGYNVSEWFKKINELKNSKKILVIYGQNYKISQEDKKQIEKFANLYNCVISVDHLSNLNSRAGIKTFFYSRVNSFSKNHSLFPDIVITMGGNSISPIKSHLKQAAGQFKHWSVREDGKISDPFNNLTDIFECSNNEFINFFVENGGNELTNNYIQSWRVELSSKTISENIEIPYSDLYVVQQLMKQLPYGSSLYLANANSVRLAQYFNKNEDIIVNCHRGTNGIDGTFSSFIAHAHISQNLNFLIIGDLSFFYGMNAIWNSYVGKNVRILLNNNQGSDNILYPIYQRPIDCRSFEEFTIATHQTTAKGWMESQGFRYLTSNNENELSEALNIFISDNSAQPIILESFTDKYSDLKILHEFESAFKTTSPVVNRYMEESKKTIKILLKKITPNLIKRILRE